jgi:uncharacterized protein (DUF362 family)
MNEYSSRRDFIRNVSGGIMGLGLGAVLPVQETEAAPEKSKVAVIRNVKAISDRNVCDKRQTSLTIERALLALTGKKSMKEAWAALGVTQNDTVGIKVNCNGAGFALYAHPDLVYALTDSLSAVVRPENIIIYERSSSELSHAGFRINKDGSGVRCFGSEEGGGFHPKEGLTRIITDTCTKLINLPSLKTFDGEFAGSLFFKNHVGTVPPAEMSRCHGNTQILAQTVAKPSIREKTVLALCDGLRGTFRKSAPWYWGGIIASRDPVAAEFTALQIINEKRLQEGDPAFEIPSFLKMAESTHKLGTCTPANIDLVKAEI